MYEDFGLSSEIRYSPGYVKQIEQQLAILEEENRYLKLRSGFKSELDGVKMELMQMTSLKEQFEEKFNEMAAKCMFLEIEDSMIYDENEQISQQNKKIELLIHANEDLHKELTILRANKENLMLEIAILKDELEKSRQYAQKTKESDYIKPILKLNKPEAPHVIVSEEKVEPCEYLSKSPSPMIESKTKHFKLSVRNSAPLISTQPFYINVSSPKGCLTPSLATLSPKSKLSPPRTTTSAKTSYVPSYLRSKRIIRREKKPSHRNSDEF